MLPPSTPLNCASRHPSNVRPPQPTAPKEDRRAARDAAAQRIADLEGTAAPAAARCHPLGAVVERSAVAVEVEDADAEPDDGDQSYAAVRRRTLKAHIRDSDVERKLTECVQKLLSFAELPANPYPSLVRLMRREEAEELLWPSGRHLARKAVKASLWREQGLQSAVVDRAWRLSKLPRFGVAWRSLAPLLDGESLKELNGQLASTGLIAKSASSSEFGAAAGQGDLAIKACCAIGGEHMMAGRLVRYPRTVELVELVHVKGAVGLHDQALAAFEERIVEQSNRIDASGQHFVEYLEVYVGGDAPAGDALLVGQFGGAASAARGASHKFRPTTPRAAQGAARRAPKAVARGSPSCSTASCVPQSLAGPAAASSAPPPPARAPARAGGAAAGARPRRVVRRARRAGAVAAGAAGRGARRRGCGRQRGAAAAMEYTAVQKSFCLYYEATGSVAQLSKAQREEIAGGASPVGYEGKARDEPAGSRAPSVAPTPRSVVGDATADSSPAPPGGALRRESRINSSRRCRPSASAMASARRRRQGRTEEAARASRLRSSGTAVAAASRANSAIADATSRHPSRACAASTSATLRIRWRRTSGASG